MPLYPFQQPVISHLGGFEHRRSLLPGGGCVHYRGGDPVTIRIDPDHMVYHCGQHKKTSLSCANWAVASRGANRDSTTVTGHTPQGVDKLLIRPATQTPSRRQRRCRTYQRKDTNPVRAGLGHDTPLTPILAASTRHPQYSQSRFFIEQGPRWCHSVRTVVTDGSHSYRAAIQLYLPGARHVLDRFHAARWFTGRTDPGTPRTATPPTPRSETGPANRTCSEPGSVC